MTVAHFTETQQIVFAGARTEGAVFAGRGEVTAVQAHVFCRLLINISQACLNQEFGRAVHEVKVVAGLVQVRGAMGIPIKAQPRHGIQDGIDVLGVFFFWIGVVKAHVADAAVITRQTKIQADAFGVTHVQVAIGFGRKAGANFGGIGCAFGVVRSVTRGAGPLALSIGALGQIGFDDLAQKVTDLVAVGGGVCRFDFVVGCAHPSILEADRGCRALEER